MLVCAATRHDWRFAAFIHFCRLFADALHLITFSADRLEAAIVEPAEHPVFLTQLLTSLLNAKAEWQHALWYKLRRQWREHLHFLYTGNPLESKTFFELSPSERVRRSPGDSYCADAYLCKVVSVLSSHHVCAGRRAVCVGGVAAQ